MEPTYPAPALPEEHPEGTKALIISILSLVCCGLLAIWSFLITKKARDEGSTDSKIQIAYYISIAAFVLMGIGLAAGAASALFGGLSAL